MKMRVAFLCCALALTACEGFGGKRSKMSGGELYQSGDTKYDGFLKKVHEEQVAAAEWTEQSKGARKPLTRALNLPPNAGNATILDAAKSKKADSAVHSAAEETAALERSFIEKQKVNADRLDKIAAEGAELKKQATEDRRNMGADKADPEKVDKKEEIKNEVAAAAEIAMNLRDDAKKGVVEAEKLIDGLKKELGIVGDGTVKAEEPKKDEPKKDEKKEEKKPEPKKHDAKPAGKKPPEAKPAPSQKPAEGEVFNP